jgi:hypothetical protein
VLPDPSSYILSNSTKTNIYTQAEDTSAPLQPVSKLIPPYQRSLDTGCQTRVIVEGEEKKPDTSNLPPGFVASQGGVFSVGLVLLEQRDAAPVVLGFTETGKVSGCIRERVLHKTHTRTHTYTHARSMHEGVEHTLRKVRKNNELSIIQKTQRSQPAAGVHDHILIRTHTLTTYTYTPYIERTLTHTIYVNSIHLTPKDIHFTYSQTEKSITHQPCPSRRPSGRRGRHTHTRINSSRNSAAAGRA